MRPCANVVPRWYRREFEVEGWRSGRGIVFAGVAGFGGFGSDQ